MKQLASAAWGRSVGRIFAACTLEIRDSLAQQIRSELFPEIASLRGIAGTLLDSELERGPPCGTFSTSSAPPDSGSTPPASNAGGVRRPGQSNPAADRMPIPGRIFPFRSTSPSGGLCVLPGRVLRKREEIGGGGPHLRIKGSLRS